MNTCAAMWRLPAMCFVVASRWLVSKCSPRVGLYCCEQTPSWLSLTRTGVKLAHTMHVSTVALLCGTGKQPNAHAWEVLASKGLYKFVG